MAGEHHEPDGIAESVEDLLRSRLLLGTRLAERRIRAREQARLRAQLDADERVPHDGLAEEHLQARRAEIDEIRDLIAAERSRTIPETPEQRRSRELRELGDAALASSGAEDVAAPGYDT